MIKNIILKLPSVLVLITVLSGLLIGFLKTPITLALLIITILLTNK